MTGKPPLVRKRACRPKVKTGCLTCRIRRVKCDEGKPHCNRCVATGRKCDGYTANSQNGTGVFEVTGYTASAPALLFLGPSHWVGTLQEQQSFHFFKNQTAPGFFGLAGTSDWANYILQASTVQPSIRHAVTALGTLHRRLISGSLPTLAVVDPSADQDLVFAIQQCNKSIHNLLYEPSNTNDSRCDPSHRPKPQSSPHRVTALAACMLYTCFAALQGLQAQALSHIRHGLKILSEIEAYRATLPPGFNECSAIPVPVLRAIFTSFDRQARAMLPEGFHGWVNSPASSFLDAPLLPDSFTSLEHAFQTIEGHYNIALTLFNAPEQLTESFITRNILPLNNIASASLALLNERLAAIDSALENLLSRADIQQQLMTSERKRRSLAQINLHRTLLEMFTRIFSPDWPVVDEHPQDSQTSALHKRSETTWDEVLPKFNDLVHYAAEVLGCPSETLDNLANTIRSTTPTPTVSEKHGLAGLGPASKGQPRYSPSANSTISSVSSSSHLPSPPSSHSFQGQNSLEEQNRSSVAAKVTSSGRRTGVSPSNESRHQNKSISPVFSCMSEVIEPLWVCASRCRDPTIRRKAIALLLHYPRREGLWDSIIVGRLAWEIMVLEESGAVENATAWGSSGMEGIIESEGEEEYPSIINNTSIGMRVIPKFALPELVDPDSHQFGSVRSGSLPSGTDSFGTEYSSEPRSSPGALANEYVESAADIPEGCRIRDITATFLDPVGNDGPKLDAKSVGIKVVLRSVTQYNAGLPGHERIIDWS